MSDSNITKRALATAMKELMEEKPFAKITVGDICDRCGLNRKSFYYHFKDKYDLVNWIFYTEFIDSLRLSDYRNGWSLWEDVCAYFYREQAFYRHALEIQGQNSFSAYFSEVLGRFLLAFSGDIFSGIDDSDSEFYVTFLTDAFLASIMRWLTEGAQIPPEDYLHQLRIISENLARKVLTDLDTLADDESQP